MLASRKTLTHKIVAAFMAVMIVLAMLPVKTAQAASSAQIKPTANSSANFTNPSNAYDGDTTSYAESTITSGDYIIFSAFGAPTGFNIPTGSTINGIAVTVRGRVTSTSGAERQLQIQVSNDSGSTYSTITGARTTTFGTTTANQTFGSATDPWGLTWGTVNVNFDSNFRVKTTITGTTNTLRLYDIYVVISYTAPPHVITASAGSGGTITPSGVVSIPYGTNQTFNIVPNANNVVQGVLIDGGASVGMVNHYTFTNVTADHAITATFDEGWSAPGAFANNNGVGNPGNVFSSNDSYATINSTNDIVNYLNFNLAIPNGATINGIEVAIEGYSTSTRNADIALSWDNGTTITTPFKTTTMPSTTAASEATVVLGSATDAWGHTWSDTDFANDSFAVRVEGTNATGGATLNIDQLQVKVFYTAPQTDQTITFGALADGTYGDAPFTVSATGGASGNPVTFSSQTPSICSVSGTTVTILQVGTCTVRASQAGNASYNPAPDVDQSFTINPATLTYTADAASRMYGAVNPTFTGTISGFVYADTQASATTGTLSFTSTATTASNVGSYAIDGSGLTANNGNYTFVQAAGNATALTIDQATSTVTVDCSVGAPYTYTGSAQTPCTASYSTSDGLSGSLTPTYSSNIDAGTVTASATFAGDANHADNSNSAAFDIGQASSTVTVDCSVGAPYTYTGSAQTPCTAQATGVGMSPVDVTASLIYSNNTDAGPATTDASWDGDINHTGSTGSGSFTIGQASQSITFNTLADKTYGDAPFTVNATGGASGNAVTFSSQTPATCSVASDTVTILSAGPCTVRASQTGNVNYSAAVDVDQSFNIASAASIITFDPAPTPTYLGADFIVNATTTNTDSSVLTYSYVSGPCSFVSGATFHSTGAGACVVQADGAATTNFNAVSQTQSVTIGQATPVIAWASPADITYGTALGATQLNASKTVSGTFNYTPAAGTVLNAGNGQALSVDFTSSDPNYKDVSGTTVTINVLQATLTVTATGVNKTYDGTTTATVHLSDDRVAGDVFTEGYTNASFVDANVGTNKHIDVTGISISGGTSGNYILAAATASAAADILADGTTTVITNAAALATDTIMGQSYPVTFTVTPNTGGMPTGNVTVSDGADVCTALVSDGTCDLTSTTSGIKILTATYTGDSNFGGSVSAGVSHTVNEAPAITSLDHATFTVATAGPAFNVITTGYPAPSITQSGTLPTGITFVDNGDGTATLNGTPASGAMGTYHITFTAASGIGTDAVQNFTLTVIGGPTIPTNGVNSDQDTGDGHLDENEIVTINLNKFTATFSKDVHDVPNTDPNYGESVINPANYILVNDNGNGFQTVDCKTGVAPQDFAITVDSVAYNNHSGEGPFVATLNVNSNNPLANGTYRLYICGTTSITDLGGLKLAGNGKAEGTDFVRNFSVQLPDNGSGNNSGGGSGGTGGFGGFIPVTGLIPVTGFAPDHSTLLPAQPADSAYSSFNDLRMEIPSLGINIPIVGVAYKNNSWDLTWLGNSAGYLDGSAYPTWSGNSVLTGHVVNTSGAPGPFAYIKDLQIGDKINIHFGGQIFVYEVRENRQVLPTMLSTIFKHEGYNWLTLVTCEDYNNARKGYNYRRFARAVLVSVVPEK